MSTEHQKKIIYSFIKPIFDVVVSAYQLFDVAVSAYQLFDVAMKPQSPGPRLEYHTSDTQFIA